MLSGVFPCRNRRQVSALRSHSTPTHRDCVGPLPEIATHPWSMYHAMTVFDESITRNNSYAKQLYEEARLNLGDEAYAKSTEGQWERATLCVGKTGRILWEDCLVPVAEPTASTAVPEPTTCPDMPPPALAPAAEPTASAAVSELNEKAMGILRNIQRNEERISKLSYQPASLATRVGWEAKRLISTYDKRPFNASIM